MTRLTCAIALLPLLFACTNQVEHGPVEGPLAEAFRRASAETGVPRELLLAVGYVETRWQANEAQVIDEEHGGAARGLMGLVDRPDLPRLAEGARLIGASPEDVVANPGLNVRAAAYVLRALALEAGPLPRAVPGAALIGWRDTLGRYGAGDDVEVGALYAGDVLAVLDSGATGVASTGEILVIEGRGKAGAQQKVQALVGDSPYAVQFLSAREGFFSYGRSRAIDRVVIHTTEGSYAGTLSWFRNPANPYQTSAHYVIRSSDGEVTQMVRERDTAHHVLNWNPRSVGIEHEAISAQAQWFTDAMYRSSARLTRDICIRYGIPMDRQHIVGHVEVPGNDHSDPGVHFDWGYYISLVQSGDDGLPPPAGCDGLDYSGACDGTVLRWCENGGVRTVECASSGQSCGWQDDATGNNCVDAALPPPPADPCGGLDYAGACDGTLLRWCENETVRSVECASTGQTCGWQSDDVGHNCVAPPPVDPCQGETWLGRCDGTELVWCEDDVVRTATCPNTCGWQSDDVGNNCL